MPNKPGVPRFMLIFLLMFASLYPVSDSKAQLQAVPALLALARPVGVKVISWLAANQANAIAALTTIAAYQFFTNDIDTSLIGKSVNEVQITVNGATTPSTTVSLEPKSIPKDTPSNWTYDQNNAISYDPSVYSAPGSTSTGSGRLFSLSGSVGCSTPQSYSFTSQPLSTIASGIASAATNGGCTNPGYANNTYGVGSINETTGLMNFTCNSPVGANCGFSRTAAYVSGSGTTPLPNASTSSPPMWPSDGRCNVVRSGNTFSGNTQDPDCFIGGNRANGPAAPPPGITQTPTSITANNGNGSTTTITINPDGSTKIISRAPSPTGSGTVENVLDIAPPVAGQLGSTYVTGQKQNTYDGIGTQTGSTPIDKTSPISGTTTTGTATSPTAPATTDICATNPTISACQPVAPGAPSTTDGLYTKQTGFCETFTCILNGFANKVKSSQLWTSTVGFFRAGNLSASCGGFSTSFSLFGRTINLDIDSLFCGPTAEQVYSALRIVLLITVIVAAFTIAIL